MERARLVEVIRDGRLGCRRRHGALQSKVVGKSSRFHLNDVLQLVPRDLVRRSNKVRAFCEDRDRWFRQVDPVEYADSLSSREAFQSFDERAGRHFCCSSFSNFLISRDFEADFVSFMAVSTIV